MRVLLDAIDGCDREAPALIGGDLNAFSLALADLADRERVEAALCDDPLRWSHPVPHEPRVVDAVGPSSGSMLSDHESIALSIRA